MLASLQIMYLFNNAQNAVAVRTSEATVSAAASRTILGRPLRASLCCVEIGSAGAIALLLRSCSRCVNEPIVV